MNKLEDCWLEYARLDAQRCELDVLCQHLRKAIEDAPHAPGCGTPCTCWKRDALAAPRLTRLP
jgi:hypothetical protein